jgi:probable HAF family extracellular repeat protein
MAEIAFDHSPKERRPMRRRVVTRGLIVLMVGLLSLPGLARAGAMQDTPAPRYAATDLGAIKGFPSTVAFGLNAKGVVVCQVYDPTFFGRAAVYRSSKLRALVKGEKGMSSGQDINASGQIVGYAQEPGGQARAMLWESGKATDLGDLGSGMSYAYAINDAGVVVGESFSTAGTFGSLPIVWVDGKVTALAVLAEGAFGVAVDINADGRVVGSSLLGPYDASGSTPQHAVAWDNGEVTDLGVIAGDLSEALGINASGQIVGRSTTAKDQVRFGPGNHAVLWDGDKITDLGTLADGEISSAAAINAQGEIVGRSTLAPGESTGAPDENHAFLWRDGKLLDLNDLVEGGSGVVLDYAYDINDTGVIIAMGTLDGVEHAYLLTPIDA